MSNDLTNFRDNFELLHPVMQEQLYQMRWRELRPIQSDAIDCIVRRQSHLIISAPTAGGKTEAAFLPIISTMLTQPYDGIGALYVGPLKALINDQFRRLEELCQRSDVPVHKWHGDVSAIAKMKVRTNPTGILLITPESIESLFINHAAKLDRMFGRLAYIVIDELHSFLDNERGAHLRSLLYRLCRVGNSRTRLVALSATFGKEEGIQVAHRWLSFRPNDVVDRVEAPSDQRLLRYQVKGYLRLASVDGAEIPSDGTVTSDVTDADRCMTRDLFTVFSDHTGLIFGNSKPQLEFHADLLARHCEYLGKRNQYRVHHGSLSKLEREGTEEALRSDIPTVAFCTSTLEMGIDVGNVSVVGQIGPPWTVASLTQRMGRSGRHESDAMDLRMFIEEDEPGPNSSLVDRLFPSLLQAVAMSELLLFQKWSEPPFAARLCISTLVQQVMSVVAQFGGVRAEILYDHLIAGGAFQNVDQTLFLMVLKSMGESDLLEQASSGELILGLIGERIVRSKDFYAAFRTNEEYSVVDSGRNVGSIDVLPGSEIDQYLILAGRRWKVVSVDHERKSIQVVPSSGGRVPRFKASGGADIHPRVRQEMRRLLFDDQTPRYLDENSAKMLALARRCAVDANVNQSQYHWDGRECTWFTWTGTKIQRTLMSYARSAGMEVLDRDIALVFPGMNESGVIQLFQQMLDERPSATDLARRTFARSLEKYDPFLENEIQVISFARNCLDVEAALACLRQLQTGSLSSHKPLP